MVCVSQMMNSTTTTTTSTTLDTSEFVAKMTVLETTLAGLVGKQDELMSHLTVIMEGLKVSNPEAAEEINTVLEEFTDDPVCDGEPTPKVMAIRAYNKYRDVDIPYQACSWGCGFELKNTAKQPMYAHQFVCKLKQPKKEKLPKKEKKTPKKEKK